ncbi:hypothetical protein [Goodfellowiella coeruleoviolacea]|uniref:Nitrile hydratase alpha /Thiocyanate hydrolase gamma domain-containing protein n=1 Tax=Goodfellowiella coeruleoviolacea TaxID=334858 RepID=A0AAE3GDH6_9PSEU|nr:hypothetical protein [Goodfellowiella coeruleoviolacea]MCP2165753.1 hypothetical protein [Goodfellowiella coeruleoviolacea]
MTVELERAITEQAWTNPRFRELLRTDPKGALAELGVAVPDGIEVDVRIQDRDTLYYLVPPLRTGTPARGGVNQIDLWRSADMFCWILPEKLKVSLLAMRRAFREAAEVRDDT